MSQTNNGHGKKIFWILRGPNSIDEFGRWTSYVAYFVLFTAVWTIALLIVINPPDIFGMCAGIAGIITGCALKYCAFLLRRNPSRAIGYIEKIFFVSIALSVANLSFQIWSEKEVLAKMLAKAPVFFWVALLIYCIVMIIGSAGMIFLVLRTISLAKLLTKEIPQQTN